MPTRDDYRVLQTGMYFEVLDLEDAGTEEELRMGLGRLKARLASSMTKEEIQWVEGQRRNFNERNYNKSKKQ